MFWVFCRKIAEPSRSTGRTSYRAATEPLTGVRQDKDVRMTLEERVARWPDEWIHQGIEQGREQGIEQGIEQGRERGVAEGRRQGQRELLRRLAEMRFGPRMANRLFASLRREEDPRRLDAIAEAVVRCETGEELLRQAHASDH